MAMSASCSKPVVVGVDVAKKELVIYSDESGQIETILNTLSAIKNG